MLQLYSDFFSDSHFLFCLFYSYHNSILLHSMIHSTMSNFKDWTRSPRRIVTLSPWSMIFWQQPARHGSTPPLISDMPITLSTLLKVMNGRPHSIPVMGLLNGLSCLLVSLMCQPFSDLLLRFYLACTCWTSSSHMTPHITCGLDQRSRIMYKYRP